MLVFFFFQAEDGIRDKLVTGVQTCALPISCRPSRAWRAVGGPPPCCLGLRRTPARRARGGPARGPSGIDGRGIPIRVVPPRREHAHRTPQGPADLEVFPSSVEA